MGLNMQEKTYGEMQMDISMLQKENEELKTLVLSLEMKVQTLEAVLQPVEKNCGSGCGCRKADTKNV